MKKFVEFSLHEYMDEHPTQQVRTWEGETIEAIEADARAWAKQMTELYSGGPTSFIKIWDFNDANSWFIKELKAIGNNPDSVDKEWIENTQKALEECYPENKIFIGVTPY